jgi:choline kinase
MIAILYVAGRGTRLCGAMEKTNKVLLEFNGQTLLERHVIHLARLGVPRLYVVTGHERASLAVEFPALQLRHGVEITEMFNPDFEEGSVLSMRTSLPALRGLREPVLVMDGDVLYPFEMLERLAKSPHRTALLLDRNYSKADDDPVVVPLRNGKPFDFIKRWQGEADATGESIGFYKIDPADLPVLIQDTETRAAASRKDSFDDVLRFMVRSGLFGAEDVTGMPWIEIDFPQDLDQAMKLILPAVDDSPKKG